MSNTSDDRSSNCVFPERSEAEGFNCGSEPNCQLNLPASLRSERTHFQGQSTEGGQGVTSGQKRKASDIEEQINDRKSTNEFVGKEKSNNNKIDPSWLSQQKIHDWTERATYAKKKKSESKTLGDLKTFAHVRQFILGQILGPPAKQVTLQGQTRASLPRANQRSLPAATTNQVVNPFAFADIFADDGSTKYPLAPLDPTLFPMGEETDFKMSSESLQNVFVDLKADRLQRENGDLKEEIRKLKEENRKMREQLEQIKIEMSPECLQNIVVELKKNETKSKSDLQEDELGYEFKNGTYLRTMYVLERPYSSARELVASLVMCSATINRPSDEEKVSRKRKKADGATM